MGYNKPDINYFNYIFEKTQIKDPKKILIIGDSLTADIQGGNLAGLETCWYNPQGKADEKDIKKDYIIDNLLDLEKIIFEK